jgi:hypothetical protein
LAHFFSRETSPPNVRCCFGKRVGFAAVAAWRAFQMEFVMNTAQPGLTPLAVHDPEMFALIQDEEKRQLECIELIASEVRVWLSSSSQNSVFYPWLGGVLLLPLCLRAQNFSAPL